MTDHTVAALLGASIGLIFLWQIWFPWREWIIANPPTYDPDLAVEYLSLPPVFGSDVFSYFFRKFVSLDTLIVILALMVITEVSKDSGLFQFIAVKSLKFSKGSPRRLLVIFCLLSFLMSTVLATTVLIIAPLTILACDALETNPAPFLISEAMVCNVGGITTMISSIPCMLVAGATFYDFLWFVVNLLPLALILLVVTLFISMRLYRKDLKMPRPERIERLMLLDEWNMVEDRGVFYRTAILLAGVIVGFIILGSAGMSWLVALVGALLFIIFSGVHPERLFREVDWAALFFFIGLFLMVGLMEEFGVLHQIGEGLSNIAQGNPVVAVISMTWITGITSGAIDNIPVTATLIPVVDIVGGTAGMESAVGTLWASLTASAVLGGALTPIASAANVLTMSVAEKENRPISYSEFLKAGVILFFVFLLVSTGYMLLRLLFLPIPAPPIL
jgi:Na+/H+ antiporter NhaD/arsenite permease-like protein